MANLGFDVTLVPAGTVVTGAGSSSIVGLSAPYYMVKVTLAVLLSYVRNHRWLPRGES